MRAPREVEVSADDGTPDRLPIVGVERGLTFGEPAIATVRDRRVHGLVGWDPRLGWVLVLEVPLEGDRPGPD